MSKSDSDALLVIAAGITLDQAMKAAEKLKAEHSVNIRILDPFTIKPIDKEAIIANAKECGGRIITVEDHYSEVCLNKLCALSSLVDKIIILMKVEIQSITY